MPTIKTSFAYLNGQTVRCRDDGGRKQSNLWPILQDVDQTESECHEKAFLQQGGIFCNNSTKTLNESNGRRA